MVTLALCPALSSVPPRAYLLGMSKTVLTFAATLAVCLTLPLIFDGVGDPRLGGDETAYEGVSDRTAALVPTRPVQVNLSRSEQFTEVVNGVDLTAVAQFEIEALILSKQPYRRDAMAVFSPLDLALGWEAMSVPELVADVRISQSGRFYWWSLPGDAAIDARAVRLSSANMHLIPGRPEHLEVMASLRAGDVVQITGYLVNARSPSGAFWNTSLTRSDAGGGACEIILLRSIRKKEEIV